MHDDRTDRNSHLGQALLRLVDPHPSVGLAQLEYLTKEWAPFNHGQKGVVSGISVDIPEAVFRNIGVNRKTPEELLRMLEAREIV